jgi:hypothetical protein
VMSRERIITQCKNIYVWYSSYFRTFFPDIIGTHVIKIITWQFSSFYDFPSARCQFHPGSQAIQLLNLRTVYSEWGSPKSPDQVSPFPAIWSKWINCSNFSNRVFSSLSIDPDYSLNLLWKTLWSSSKVTTSNMTGITFIVCSAFGTSGSFSLYFKNPNK